MSDPTVGHGSKLYVKIGETYTLVEGVRNLQPASISRSVLDTTSQDSPAGFMESLPGNTDPGAMTFELLVDLSKIADDTDPHGYLASRLYTQLTDEWRIDFTQSGTRLSFVGFVESFQMSTPHDNLSTVNVSVKISGQITRADIPTP